jgi:iron-sulfur cluster assembly protein
VATPDKETTLMLAITAEALAVIQRVTAHPAMEPTSGLRIADDIQGGSRLHVRVANGPRSGDRVLEREGGRIFLGPGTLPRLEDRELDAVADRGGRVQFILRGSA